MPEKPPSLRERQAQLTRDEILSAARRLFAERGYTRTSVRDIAEAAGVSAQTVYDSIGSKQALVARLNDLIDAEAGIAAIVGAAARSGDPREVRGDVGQGHPVDPRALRRHHPRPRHRRGRRTRPAPSLAEGHRRHVEGAGMVVGVLQELGALDASVDARRGGRHAGRALRRPVRAAAARRATAGRSTASRRGSPTPAAPCCCDRPELDLGVDQEPVAGSAPWAAVDEGPHGVERDRERVGAGEPPRGARVLPRARSEPGSTSTTTS